MTTRILLVPGYWLGGWAWDDVAARLRRNGNEVDALTLPGRDPDAPDRLTATLEDQTRAIIRAAAVSPRTVLVAHSGGGAPAYRATDVAPGLFARTIYVDSSPLPPGYRADYPELDDTGLALPEWDAMVARGTSLAGLDDAMLDRFAARAVSEPRGVVEATLQLSDDPARYGVPTTVVCSSFDADTVRQMRDAGTHPMFAELNRFDDDHLDYLDLPTGHWPMWSRSAELADIIHAIAHR